MNAEAWVGLALILSFGCGDDAKPASKCRLSQLLVSTANDNVVIVGVTVDAGGCGPAKCVSNGEDAGCSIYSIDLTATGQCQVRVTLADGVIVTESVAVSVTSDAECRGEFRPDRDIRILGQ